MTEENNLESLDAQSKILEEINSLKKEFQSKIKYDEQKEKTITKLHDELQIYKRDLYKKLLLPMINDVIQFTNRAEKDFEFLADANREKLFERMYDFLDDLRDVLYRQGVEAYKLEGDIFDPKKQRILKTIETNSKDLDKKVANHKTYGYEWEGKIIKPEGIDIYVYKEINVADDAPVYSEIKKEEQGQGKSIIIEDEQEQDNPIQNKEGQGEKNLTLTDKEEK